MRSTGKGITGDTEHVDSLDHSGAGPSGPSSTTQTPALSAVTSPTTTRANDDIILVTWEENDPTNPMNVRPFPAPSLAHSAYLHLQWSKAKKWRTTILLCFMCLFMCVVFFFTILFLPDERTLQWFGYRRFLLWYREHV